jgi:hypothetical protein
MEELFEEKMKVVLERLRSNKARKGVRQQKGIRRSSYRLRVPLTFAALEGSRR